MILSYCSLMCLSCKNSTSYSDLDNTTELDGRYIYSNVGAYGDGGE